MKQNEKELPLQKKNAGPQKWGCYILYFLSMTLILLTLQCDVTTTPPRSGGYIPSLGILQVCDYGKVKLGDFQSEVAKGRVIQLLSRPFSWDTSLWRPEQYKRFLATLKLMLLCWRDQRRIHTHKTNRRTNRDALRAQVFQTLGV